MESQYLDLMRRCLEASSVDSRNGKVRSVFGAFLTCDLAQGFPLLTTKQVWLRGVVEELAWFLRGSTNVVELHKKKVRIWDGNTVDRQWDAGPVYGFQWRHYGATYTNCKADYTGKGIDQIETIIDLIRHNPLSRRIVLNAWNPKDQPQMCLPPCHVMYQFYVQHGKLSCLMTQRSADVFLGLPFNIASSAMLVHLLCNETGLEPGRLMVSVGNAHVYQVHEDVCREQLSRELYPPPKLTITRPKDGLWNVKWSDVELEHYACHHKLLAPMVA